MAEYQECSLCSQTRSCQFCDFEALKATVENRLWPQKYIRTPEGYKKVICFDASNVPPNPMKPTKRDEKRKLSLRFGEIPRGYNLEVLAAYMQSNAEITREARLWLSELFSKKSGYAYKLTISGRADEGIADKQENGETPHWYAVKDYKALREAIGDTKAKEKIVKSYNISQRKLNEAIIEYEDEESKKAGLEPKKRQRGRPKKYA